METIRYIFAFLAIWQLIAGIGCIHEGSYLWAVISIVWSFIILTGVALI